MIFKRILFILFAFFSIEVLFSQSLPELIMEVPSEAFDIPENIRKDIIENKGNTLKKYNDYKLSIYDKRNKFVKIITPLENTYELAVWKTSNKGELLIGIGETKCGNNCGTKLYFYLVSEGKWKLQPTENYIPEITLDDILDEKKMEKNYYTSNIILKNLKLKTQFFLPQVGNNIMILFTCLDELEKENYQKIFKYLKGTTMELIWKKEKFVKGIPFFSI